MDIEHGKLWTAALRSGEFPQTDGMLAKQEKPEEVVGYCCIGVACVIAEVEHETFPGDEEYEDEEIAHYFGGARELAPLELLDWLGLESEDSSLSREYDLAFDFPEDLRSQGTEDCRMPGKVALVTLTASTLNDAGFTFDQIADLIDYFGVRPVT